MTEDNAGVRSPDAAWLAYALAMQAEELLLIMGQIQVIETKRRWRIIVSQAKRA